MSIKQISLIVTGVTVGIITIATALVLLRAPGGQPTQTPPPAVSDLTVENLLKEVNEERVKAGVQPLAIDPLLNKSAQLKADEIERTKVFEHIAPDGKRGLDYIRESGASAKCIFISENLAAFTQSANQTAEGWASSEAHRKAMLDPRYDTTGFGIAGEYRVQHFCDLP